MSAQREHLAFLLALGLIAASAISLLSYSTPEGLGLSDDSIAYIAGARSLLQGHGYREIWLASSQPVTHFPPGFSAVLAMVGLLTGLDPLRGARLVNGLLFGANIILLGMLGWQMTRSRPAGLILALLFAVNASLLRLHAAALSEPLYILLSLLAFLSFARYIETERNIWLVLTGALVGAAYLTRYAGLALLVTIVLALILLRETWHKRLISAALFGVSALPWLIVWSLRNRLLGGTATNRAFEWHPITAENIDTAIYNISIFFIPVEAWRRALIKIPGFFETVVILPGLGLMIWIVSVGLKRLFKPQAVQPEIHSLVNGLYVFGYLAAMIIAMVFFDASTKFKLRILSPIYVSLLMLLVAGGMWLWNRRSSVYRSIVMGFAVLIIGLSIYDTAGVAAILHKGGEGYASFRWYDSKAMEFLRGLPSKIMIYTNEPGAVFLYTGRGTYVLPDHIDPVTGEPRPGFTEGVANMKLKIRAGLAVLALFDGGETPPEDTAILAEGLYLAHKSAGDAIYSAAP
jgi:4-amino-4-deoxy-L-arabinose transferase-like glycosyltransferase